MIKAVVFDTAAEVSVVGAEGEFERDLEYLKRNILPDDRRFDPIRNKWVIKNCHLL